MLRRSDMHGYQEECVEHILSHNRCGLFVEMGLGKTVAALTAIRDLIYDRFEVSKALVVAPKRVAETVWAEEAAKWEHLKDLKFSKIIGDAARRVEAVRARADVYIISRDNVAWLTDLFGGRLPYQMVVVDELSSFKNPSSVRFKALKKNFGMYSRFVGLTGTPAPNGLMDLWSQVYLMDCGARLGRTLTEYRMRYFTPGQTNGHVVYNYIPKPGAFDAIKGKLSDICMSMSAKDYLSLPERVDNVVSVRMDPDVRERYERFERRHILEMSGQDITAINASVLSNKLLQFANGAVYDESGGYHVVHDEKVCALKEIIDGNPGKPVLVAWSFRSDRDRLMEALKEFYPRELLTGKDIADWNAGSVRVMLAHPASAGHGLNLQAGGNIIVWFGVTWSLELYQQFNARLMRQGQTNAVVVHHIVLAGTHDEDVLKAIRRKTKSQDSLMDAIKKRIDKYLKTT